MQHPLADALVLVFPPSASLRESHRLGIFEREWALVERLAPHYGRVMLVTHGGPDDEVLAPNLGGRVSVVPALESAAITGTVVRALADCSSVFIRTQQFRAGPVALLIRDALRSDRPGRPVCLFARGGYIPSRFLARELGADSPEAREAGESEHALCRVADMVAGTSVAMVNDMAWRYGLARDGVRLIPNYVLTDTPPASPESREAGLILCCGDLKPRKRFDAVIEAVALLRDDARDGVRVRIVGEGPERDRLAALSAERAVPCEFVGRMPHRDLRREMERCAVYVQASEMETHPKTVIEAMASGAPVVVADSPGLGGVVQNGATGLRAPGTPEGLAQALGAVLSDPEWRAMLGEAAARVAREAWGIEHIIQQELEAHRAALARAARRASAPDHPREVCWDTELLNLPPTQAAERWMQSFESFARRLTDAGRAELIAGLERQFRRRGAKRAA